MSLDALLLAASASIALSDPQTLSPLPSSPPPASPSAWPPQPGSASCYEHVCNATETPLILRSRSTDRKVLFCLIPKAASLMLRLVALAYDRQQPFSPGCAGQRIACNASSPQDALVPVTLCKRFLAHDVLDMLLNRESIERIMFVRHPVARIFSGWKQLNHRGYPKHFHDFVERQLPMEYDPGCGPVSMALAADAMKQHYAPAQHCRCGLRAGVPWKVLRLEEQPLLPMLRELLGPSDAIPKDGYQLPAYTHLTHLQTLVERERGPPASARLPPEEYLTPAVLKTLNDLTRTEQRILGYLPYSPPPPSKGSSHRHSNHTQQSYRERCAVGPI